MKPEKLLPFTTEPNNYWREGQHYHSVIRYGKVIMAVQKICSSLYVTFFNKDMLVIVEYGSPANGLIKNLKEMAIRLNDLCDFDNPPTDKEEARKVYNKIIALKEEYKR